MRLRLLIAMMLLALIAMPYHALADDTPADEKAVLAQLFTLNRQLDESRQALAALDDQAGTLLRKQGEVQAERDRLETERARRQAQFATRLRFYHEQGTIAPFAILFGAKTFPDFLTRVDALGMLLRHDAFLIRTLKELKAAVDVQDRTLAAQREALAKLRSEQAGIVSRLEREVAEKEAILTGLKDRRSAVEQQLDELERRWNADARPVLDALGGALQSLATNLSDFQPDSVDFTLLPPGATVQITDKTLNQFFGQVSALKGLAFRLPPDAVNLEGEFGGTKLRVEGRFVVAGKTVLRYEPKAIYVQEFAAPPSVLKELVASGHLDVDLGPIVKPLSLQDVKMLEGKLVLKTGLK